MPFPTPGVLQCCAKKSHYLNYLFLSGRKKQNRFAYCVSLWHEKENKSFAVMLCPYMRWRWIWRREKEARDVGMRLRVFIVTWKENSSGDTSIQHGSRSQMPALLKWLKHYLFTIKIKQGQRKKKLRLNSHSTDFLGRSLQETHS